MAPGASAGTHSGNNGDLRAAEMSEPNPLRTLSGRMGKLTRLGVIAWLGLMLWLGWAASASAQNVSPSSPCPLGGNQRPPGWNATSDTPDCSNTAAWYEHVNTVGTVTHPWALGNVPATPGGHTTFITNAASIGGFEGVSTTITGLSPGREYNVTVYLNGNYVVFPSVSSSSCSVIISVNGVSTTFPAASGNSWAPVLVSFVASGASATLAVRAQQTSTTVCQSNIYVGADAVVPAVVDADLQMTKTVSPTGAVASGSVLTFTLVATNNGPSVTTNVLLRDTPGAGLDCTTPSPSATCSASGGASCPGATVPVSSLTGGGVSLPSLPVGGQVAVTMQCTVTATGR
jgi:uncharacterized repeat protein (TIGR01451 family)